MKLSEIRNVKKKPGTAVKDTQGHALKGKTKKRALSALDQKLNEEGVETKPIADVWDENGDGAKQYTSIATYLVRQIPKVSPARYEAFSEIGGKRRNFGKYTAAELETVLTPIRPDQTPDAEGFTTYMDPNKIDAFQYTGDPIYVTLDDDDSTEVQVNSGDYITRKVKGKSYEYAAEKKADFESSLKLSK